MAGKLPKVTEYIKNVGKSVGYAAIDTVSEPAKNINSFVSDNEELFKTIYSATKNYKQTLRKVDRKIKMSKVYEAADYGFKCLKDDLRTGQFYNKEREKQASMSSVFGDDFADFSEFDAEDFDFSEDRNDDGVITSSEKEPPIEVQAMSKTAAGLGGIINATSKAQSNVIIASAEAINQSNRASYRLLASQNERINASIIGGFSGVTAGLDLVNKMMGGPLTQYMNESTKFYGDVSNKLNETNAYLKELTEMQRNLYKVQERQYKIDPYDDIVNSNGMPDLTKYAKKIYKNIMDLDPAGGMLGDGMGDGNMFKMFVSNPMKAIPLMLAKVLIPTTITKSMDAFDKNMTGLFSSFIARMNKWADSDSGGLINIKGIIGSLLGIKIDKKTKLDTSKYNRGPIPFDGETKKAIVDVIPAYLARIESAISGMPERVFDGKTGKFKTVAEVRKDFIKQEKDAIKSVGYDMEPFFEEWVRNRISSDRSLTSDKQRNKEYARIRSGFDNAINQIYEDGGDFKPYSGYKNNKGKKKYQGNMNDKEWIAFMDYMRDPSHPERLNAFWSLAQNTFEAKSRLKRSYEGNEGQYMNAALRLFDGSQMGFDKNGKPVTLDYKKNNLFNNNANSYLKDILAEVRYIRIFGLSGGGSGKGGKGGPSGNTPSFTKFKKSQGFSDDVDLIDDDNQPKNLHWYAEEKARRENEKEKSLGEKYGLTSKNLKEMEAAKTFAEKIAAIRKSVDNLLKSPAKMVTDVIHAADKRFFETMFGTEDGEKFKDKAGLEYQGFLDYLVGRTSRVFDELEDKIKKGFKSMWESFKGTKVGGWIANKGGQFARNVGGRLKSKYGWAKNRGRQAVGNTFGVAAQKMGFNFSGVPIANVVNADDIAGDHSEEALATFEDQVQNIPEFSSGGIVTKYGLSMLSPGEIVIPNPTGKARAANLRGEKREKSRIMSALRGGARISHHAEGTVDDKKEQNKVNNIIKKVMHEVGGEGADVVADALIGGGVSLITGLVGGPLLGAAVGAGVGLTKHSETVRKFMFGENDEGGAIPKSVIDFFKKHSDGMIDFGVAGGIAGLFTPLGLVGGALAGATLGFAKDTSWFQDMMFGNEEKGKTGFMSNETKEKLKKALPAMGIGAGVGILTGPFGLVGNAILGSAAGYITTSEEFKSKILGEKDANGKRHGGLTGALKAGLVDPLTEIVLGKVSSDGKRKGGLIGDATDWFKNTIIKNTQKVFDAAGQLVRNTFLSLGDRISDALSGVFKKHIGMPFEEFMREKIFKKVSGLLGGLTKGALGIAKAVVGAPFKLAGYASDSIMMAQMGRGTLDTKNAQERLDLRKKNKIRAKKMQLTGRDKTYDLDMALASMDSEQLEQFNSNIKTFMKNRGQKNLDYHNKLESAGSAMSTYMTANGMWDNNKGYNLKKQILNLLQSGELNKKEIEKLKKKYKLSDEQMQGILSTIDQNAIAQARQLAIDESGLDADAVAQLEKATGYTNLSKANNRYFKQLLRYGNTELKFRNRKKQATNPTEGELKNEIKEDPIIKKTEDIIDVLRNINNNIVAGNHGIGNTYDNKGKVETANSDGKKQKDAEAKVEEENNLKKGIFEKLSDITSGIGSFLGLKKNKNEGEKKESWFSKLLGGIKSGGSKVLGTVGKVALGLGGISLLGYGSEFLKTHVTPWFTDVLFPKIEQSKAFQWVKSKVDWFVNGIKDGSFFQALASKFTQGLVFFGKNVAGPLTAAVVNALPAIASGIVSGILGGLWDAIKGIFKSKKEVKTTKISSDFDNVIKSLPTGTDEDAFAKDFSGLKGSSVKVNDQLIGGSMVNSAYSTTYGKETKKVNMPTYSAPGTYQNDNGSTSVVDENGSVEVFSEDGTSLGKYNNDTGEITETHAAIEKEGSLSNWIKNGFVRGVATGTTSGLPKVLSAAGSGLSKFGKALTKIPGGKTLGRLTKLGGWAANTTSKIGGAVNSAGAAIANAATNLYEKGTSTMMSDFGNKLQTIGNFKSSAALADGTQNIVQSAVTVASGTVETKFGKFFEWLSKSKFMSVVTKFLGKAGKWLAKSTTKLSTLFPSLGTKIGKLATSSGIMSKMGSKVLNAIGGMTPLALAAWIGSFEEGCRKCETILGVSKDVDFNVTTGVRVITGLVKAINDNLLWGFIPIDKVMDLVIDVLGDVIGIDKEELEDAQKETEELLTKISIETGEEVSLGMHNNQENIFKSIYRWATGQSNKYRIAEEEIKDSSENSSSTSDTYSGSGRNYSSRGRGRGGQQGGKYANMPYGNSTIGQAGCAPVAAASMLGGNIPEAAGYAQLSGHVGSDGSTDIGFFNDYFSAKGISNRTTTSRGDVSKALDNGQSAVLLGRDPGGGSDSAYSNSSHYITARKGKDGNYLVNDPALGVRKMSKSKVLKNMHASVITGRGREDDLNSQSTLNEAIGTAATGNSAAVNASKIVNMALSQVGTKEGKNNDNKYGKEYGLNNAAWCCIFVWWVFKHAGASKLFYNGNKCASCTTLMDWYKAKGQQVSDIKAGDLLFFNFDSNPNRAKAKHIGIAVGCESGGKVYTVEGNTSSGESGSQSNGDGVYKRHRSVSSIICVIRPAYDGATFDTAIPAGTYYNYETGEETSSGGLFDSIVGLGKSMVKAIFGEGLYNAVFGDGDDDTSSESGEDYIAKYGPVTDDTGALVGGTGAEKAWKYLRSLGYSEAGASAILGSLFHESGIRPNNLQNTYEKSLGSDSEYTDKVNTGKYSKDKFMNDDAGYGLAQWTFSSRKGGLYDSTIGKGKSIADMKSQLDYLNKEVSDYGLDSAIKSATSIEDANNIFVGQFEKPAGSETPGSAVYTSRLNTAKSYYNQYKGTGRRNSRFNNVGYGRDDVNTTPTAYAGAGSVSYTKFLETIVTLLMSMVDNTAALNKILEILSDKFDIKLSSSEISTIKDSSDTAAQARNAINKLMASKTNAADVANVLQGKNTEYLVEVMSSIAKE